MVLGGVVQGQLHLYKLIVNIKKNAYWRFLWNENIKYMKSIEFIYNNQRIEFLQGENNIMVNATQMAKVFGKLPKDFLKNTDTQRFINSCMKRAIKKENSPFLNVKTKTDLVNTKQKTGTYMHRILALKFAAWLDPDFEVWVL